MSEERSQTLSAVKLSLMARKLRQKSEDLSILAADPIAIVGMACRFPGGSDSPDLFWRNIASGVDAISEIPADRWAVDDYYDPDLNVPGTANSRWGGFVSDVDMFDPIAFGIAPSEAAFIDPQQRMLLEVAWEAFDDAGWPLDSLQGSKTGVFFSLYGNDYGRAQYNQLDHISAHTVTGTEASVAAGRLSYLFDLRGPSMVVDTACSSSLVAIHMAMQSIRSGESSVAIAGGGSLILSPAMTVSLAKWGMLAPDGRCKTFDASANGFVRGEGCGLIVMKRLSDALLDSDRIHAVIRGSATNQDGRSNVLTAPNGEAQKAVIRAALKQAKVSPRDIGYVECHGTGTKIGDPIEVGALSEVLGSQSVRSNNCFLGAVKANIGHLEAAAGIAGVIKAVLCMRHKAIPPQLHFNTLNPLIDIEKSTFRISSELTSWKTDGKVRFAGISSFGFAGSNAHVVLEDAAGTSALAAPRSRETPFGTFVLPFSAKSSQGVSELAARYCEDLAACNDPSDLENLCFTASTRRSHFSHRFAAVGNDAQELMEQISLANDEPCHTDTVKNPKIGFVFSGQGCNWHGMARSLLANEDVFRQAVAECDEELSAIADWSILDKLQDSSDKAQLEETVFFQPVLLAIQIGLVSLWKSWGISPVAVMGHSVGEIAAAHCAGILSTASAIQIVEMRARLMQESAGLGSMAAVGLSAQDLKHRVKNIPGLSVAASNSPSSSTLSGDKDAVRDIIILFEQEGIFCRKLNVECAFHSEQMEPHVQPLMDGLIELQAERSKIPFVSTVNGLQSGGGEKDNIQTLDAGYWARNLRDQVLFSEAVGEMVESGCTAFVEIGPHPVLSGYVAEISGGNGTSRIVQASMRRDQDCRRVIREALGKLYTHGCDLNWPRITPPGQVVSLPAYPWQKERYWLDWISDEGQSSSTSIVRAHPLLGQRIDTPATNKVIFRNELTTKDSQFLGDHRIGGVCLLPAAAMIEMMLSAGDELTESRGLEDSTSGANLQELSIEAPLILLENVSRQIQLVATRAGDQFEMSIYSRPGEPSANWVLHATGVWCVSDRANVTNDSIPLVEFSLASTCDSIVDPGEFYREGRVIGLEFGESFRVLESIKTGDRSAVAKISASVKSKRQAKQMAVHPAILDGCLQVVDAAARQLFETAKLLIPISIGEVEIVRPLDENLVIISSIAGSANVTPSSEIVIANVGVYNEMGELLASIRDIALKVTGNDAIAGFQRDAKAMSELGGEVVGCQWLYEMQWCEELTSHKQQENSTRKTQIICTNDAIICNNIIEQLGKSTPVSSVHVLHPALNSLVLSESQFLVDSYNPESFREAIRTAYECAKSGGSAIDVDVVFLWDTARGRSGIDGLESSNSGKGLQKDVIASALHLAQALVGTEGAEKIRLLVVTKGAHSIDAAYDCKPSQAAVWGLAATLQVEHPELNCALIDLDPHSGVTADTSAILAEMRNTDLRENRIAYRNGTRRVARLVPLDEDRNGGAAMDPTDFQLQSSGDGIIENLVAMPLIRKAPGRDEIEIQTHAVGINFRDVLSTLNVVAGASGSKLGAECSGRVIAVGDGVKSFCVGDSVMAFAMGGFASRVTVPELLATKIPREVGFVEAAGIPVVFLTAKYALDMVASLSNGQSILIHSAAGGVGLAALKMAKMIGANVLATAGSVEKREMLRSLGVDHVFDSRSIEFAKQIRSGPAVDGVDVVLNALSGDMIPAGLSVVRDGGMFIELGKRDDWDQKKVQDQFPGVQYCRFDLTTISEESPELIAAMLRKIVTAFNDHKLATLPTSIFPFSKIVEAFRTIAQGNHIGKLVVPVPHRRNEDECLVNPGATYLITGGLGSLGMDVAEQLVADGATSLILVGRSDGSKAAQARVKKIRSAGVCVEVAHADVGDISSITRVFEEMNSDMLPLRGVVHCAGELNDAAFLGQTWDKFLSVMNAKVDGAWNLHKLTLACELDFFVLFSSAAAVIGWPGQANYACGNAAMDALAHYRRARGLTALSINWGAWETSGMAARTSSAVGDSFAAGGLVPQSNAESVKSFSAIAAGSATQVLIAQFDWEQFSRRYPWDRVPGMFDIVRTATSASRTTEMVAEGSRASSILDALADAPAGQERRVLARYLEQQAAATLGFSANHSIDRNIPLNEQGLDSLLAVAMRNRLSSAFNQNLPASLLFDFPSISALVKHIAADVLNLAVDSKMVTDKLENQEEKRNALADEIVELSDIEAERLLQQELASLSITGGAENER